MVFVVLNRTQARSDTSNTRQARCCAAGWGPPVETRARSTQRRGSDIEMFEPQASFSMSPAARTADACRRPVAAGGPSQRRSSGRCPNSATKTQAVTNAFSTTKMPPNPSKSCLTSYVIYSVEHSQALAGASARLAFQAPSRAIKPGTMISAQIILLKFACTHGKFPKK